MPDGYVYVLINTEYDGFVKVGKTTRPPVERAEELSRSSGLHLTFDSRQGFPSGSPRASLGHANRRCAFCHSGRP
jgi:hypothetical protein